MDVVKSGYCKLPVHNYENGQLSRPEIKIDNLCRFPPPITD